MKTSFKLIQEIKENIANNKLEEAIRLLKKLLDGAKALDELILQSGRHVDIMQQIRLGTINHSEATITKNQIRLGLVQLLQDIQKHREEPRLLQEIDQVARRIYWHYYLALILKLSAVILMTSGLIMLFFRMDVLKRLFQGRPNVPLEELFFPVMVLIIGILIYNSIKYVSNKNH